MANSLLLFSLLAYQGPLDAPYLSEQCRLLIDAREQKLGFQRRLKDLVARNKALMATAPREKRTLLKKLKKTFRELSYKLEEMSTSIKMAEEEAILKGCPGIILSLAPDSFSLYS